MLFSLLGTSAVTSSHMTRAEVYISSDLEVKKSNFKPTNKKELRNKPRGRFKLSVGFHGNLLLASHLSS